MVPERTVAPQTAKAGEVPFLVYGAPLIGEAEIAEVVDTLRSGWLGTGPKTQRFEQAMAEYLGVPQAVALNSCTAGLHLALDVLGLGPGDEVITTPMTFVATANVIVHTGATPVFADVDPVTGNLDPASVAAAITPRTKAILVVHYTGRAAEMDTICALARQHTLAVVEDCAHAIETLYHGAHAGTLGDIAAYSFYATKNLVTGEGGLVVTTRPEFQDALRCRSLHGLNRNAWQRYGASGSGTYEAVYPGYKYNMMDIQASLGIHQLARLESSWQRRRTIWQRYDEAFAGLDILETPAPTSPGCRDAYHLYTVRLDLPTLRVDRDGFADALRERRIGTGVHFWPVHLHRWYRETFQFRENAFPHAEAIGRSTLSLPLSPAMSDADSERVIAAVHELARTLRR
ncbi:MAG: DegT/DnrJ/EryC1/StrS family aminotransferase [Candidatus Sericytochromatia bacterium]|nr:DegT/DnrJ/EryC1/StrS family aminotransferase [Candidatus Sericytochromatia bacterium]